MSEKHTPGPWVAKEQKSRNGETLGWIIDHSNGRIGWSSYATAEPNQGEGAPYTQGGVNAHLIAAAPDLLAALKAASDELVLRLNSPLRVQIDAAIAKAEGRE